MIREKKRSFVEVECEIFACLRVRTEQCKRDKCGVSWLLLKEKNKKWGGELGCATFEASDGWLNATIERHGFKYLNLYGEANDITDDECEVVIEL